MKHLLKSASISLPFHNLNVYIIVPVYFLTYKETHKDKFGTSSLVLSCLHSQIWLLRLRSSLHSQLWPGAFFCTSANSVGASREALCSCDMRQNHWAHPSVKLRERVRGWSLFLPSQCVKINTPVSGFSNCTSHKLSDDSFVPEHF